MSIDCQSNDPDHAGIVALYNVMQSVTCGKSGIVCTGTLVHPNWVLTAGHCVRALKGPASDVLTGTVEDKPCNAYLHVGIGHDESDILRNLYKIDKIFVSESLMNRYLDEERDRYMVEGDIALIRLKDAVSADIATPIPVLHEWLQFRSRWLANMWLPEILDGFDENCDNGIEDDGNGQSDCYDTLCMSEKTCTPDTNEGSVSYPEQEDAPVKEHSTSGCSVSGLSAGGLGIWALMAGGIAVLRGRKKEFKV